MSTIAELTAERDALKARNEALEAQATQLIGDLTHLRAEREERAKGGVKANVFGGGQRGAVSRDVLDAMTPGARKNFLRVGGAVVD